jgi:LacI family transcriptional regulator
LTGTPRGEQPVTRLADVARAAGVGISTASRVLNDDPTISIREDTRERIRREAQRLDYRPNWFARGLKLARTATFGMVMPNLAYPVNAEIIRGAERAAAAAGYVLVLVDAEEFLQAGDAFRRLLQERRVDGLLIASAPTTARLPAELRALPFVLVNRRVPRLGASVTVDDAAGMRLAVEHLIELGHTRIAHIAGPREADTARRRLAGFRAAMRAAGLAIDTHFVTEASFEEAEGYEAMERLLDGRPGPTAVAVWSLAAAVGALAAARRRGLRVPEHLSVIAFHDAPLAAYLDPPLTTIRMPLRELGARSVECLLRLVEGGAMPSIVIRTPPVLVFRDSTAPPPRTRR